MIPIPNISGGAGGISASSKAESGGALRNVFGARTSYSGIAGGASPFGMSVEPWHIAAAVGLVAVLLIVRKK